MSQRVFLLVTLLFLTPVQAKEFKGRCDGFLGQVDVKVESSGDKKSLSITPSNLDPTLSKFSVVLVNVKTGAFEEVKKEAELKNGTSVSLTELPDDTSNLRLWISPTKKPYVEPGRRPQNPLESICVIPTKEEDSPPPFGLGHHPIRFKALLSNGLQSFARICMGTPINVKKLGEFCIYSVMTAGHCAKEKTETGIFTIKKFMGAEGRIRLSHKVNYTTHPKFIASTKEDFEAAKKKPDSLKAIEELNTGASYDVSIVDVESKCVKDMPIYDVSDKPLFTDKPGLCSLMGPEGKYTGQYTAVREQPHTFAVNIHESAVGRTNAGKTKPGPGWSGAGVVRSKGFDRRVYGCLYKDQIGQGIPNFEGVACTGTECMTWVKREVEKRNKPRLP